MIIDSGKNHHWMLNESYCAKCVGGQEISMALKYFTTDNVLITKGRRVTLEKESRYDLNQVIQGNFACYGTNWHVPPGRLHKESLL